MKRKETRSSYSKASFERERGCNEESAPTDALTGGLRKKARAQSGYSGMRVAEKVRAFEDLSNTVTSSHLKDAFREGQYGHQKGIVAVPYREPGQLQLKANPSVLKTIQSPYGKSRYCYLSIVLFAGKETIWISGTDKHVYQINFEGEILDGSTFKVEKEVNVLGLNLEQQLFFSLSNFCSGVYKCNGENRTEILNISPWNSTGLCFTENGHLLVSMRSGDGARVVRYVETSENNLKAVQTIQNDQLGKSFFSTGIDVLLLTENGNGDICVADHAGEKVMVFNSKGDLRFTYKGKVTNKSEERSFRPNQIATDVNFQILINDFSRNVHVIDQHSSFICYIEHDCSGGLSIDADHNLLAGDYFTGEIKVIKYLEK